MRPYFTVIYDSFHEAFASRVLWILLALSTFVLGILALFSMHEQRALQFRPFSIHDFPGLVLRIKEESLSKEPTPGKQIWKLSGDEFRQAVDQIVDQAADKASGGKGKSNTSPTDVRKRVAVVIDQLNELLANKELYDEAAWATTRLDADAEELLQQSPAALGKDDLAYLNRLLLVAAYRIEMADAPPEELSVSFAIWSIGEPLPVTREIAEPFIKEQLAVVMALLVGVLAVFVAILVTAPIIPRTFEAGAVDLLLSKPISRSLLYLAKFVGGCAFILFNAGYFIVGLWIILGLRLGIWSSQLLLCIPIFMFLFSIYYAVSSWAGVIWKNAIVSIVITIVFWAACFIVGVSSNVIENVFIKPNRLVTIVPAKDSILAVNQAGQYMEWHAEKKKWEEVLQGKGRRRRPPIGGSSVTIGPVYDAAADRMLFMQTSAARGPFQIAMTRAEMVEATRSGAWTRHDGPTAPTGASWLFLNEKNEPLVVASAGVYRYEGSEKSSEEGNAIAGFLSSLLSFSDKAPFVSLGPTPELAFSPPFAAALNRETGNIVVFGDNTLAMLGRNEEGEYVRTRTRDFETRSNSAALAFGGSKIAIAFKNGDIHILNADDLSTDAEFQPAAGIEPYQAIASDDGRWFVVLFHDESLWVYDAQQKTTHRMRGDISAAAFDGNQQLLVADRVTRVTRYKLDGMRVGDRMQPNSTALERFHRYFLQPLYIIFPKPGELSNLVHYLLTDQQTVAIGQTQDLREARIKIDVYGPLWSNLAFVVVMLGLTCFHIHRADM